MTMQRAMNPSPCAQPNTIVSVSNPGISQNRINPLKIASSTQESHLTQVNSGPGSALEVHSQPSRYPAVAERLGARGESCEHDSLLLPGVSH